MATSAACARVTSAAKLLDKSPTDALLAASIVIIRVSNVLPGSAAVAVAAFPPIFKLVTGVVDITVNGAVPVVTVELITVALTFPPAFISCETSILFVVVAPVISNVPLIFVFPAFTIPTVDTPVISNVPVPVILVAVISATVELPDTVKLVPTVDEPDVDIFVNEPESGFVSPILPSNFPSKLAFIVPTSPENTLPSSTASGIYVNLWSVSSIPKNPAFATSVLYLNLIPLSKLSSASDCPISNTGSLIVITVESIVVVVPATEKLPITVKSCPIFVFPSITISPPIFTFFATPNPPAVTIEPLSFPVDSVVDVFAISPVNVAPVKLAFNASAF